MPDSVPPDLSAPYSSSRASSPAKAAVQLPTALTAKPDIFSPSTPTRHSSAYRQPSAQNLQRRRHTLQKQRRVRFLQKLCRLTVIGGLATVTITAATSPRWQIQGPQQVNLSGNQLLSDDALYEMLALDYPEPLLQVEPEALEQHLLEQGPIADAVVSRRLFPPGLNVYVHERHPVAIALPDTRTPITSVDALEPFSQKGLLDESGYWMPYQSFSQIADSFTLPSLQVEGMQAAYQPHWPALYAQIKASPVQVSGIDWRSPHNLILHTELGTVHLGPYGQSFAAQLTALDKMRRLPTQLELENIAFIDLRNPEQPAVEILQATGQP